MTLKATPGYHGARKTWRAGNSRVVSLPPGPLCSYDLYSGDDGCFVLVPVKLNQRIIEVD